MKEYKAAIYLRLSKEDKKNNNSIDFQREITRKYASEHNYNVIDEYVDNGFSGMLASRPALDRLMIDIVKNKIDMLIVKDISRITRNKKLTSYYTDIFFPDNDVRLISVTEYIDTGERYNIDDIVALKGIVNQSYLEDISKKIKSVKRNFKEQGKFIETSVAYGYKKDKYKLIVDENVSYVVKEIFSLFISGVKPTKIAEKLNEDNILTPSQYLNLKRKASYWTKDMVNRILNNPIYTGRLVLNKYENDFRLKKRVTTPKNQYLYKDNTHDAIIKQEDFDMVQEMKGNRSKKDNKKYLFLLQELVFCKNCGRCMTYKNCKPIRMDCNGFISGTNNDLGYFVCNEHYRHKEICNSSNKIMECDLNKLVLYKISCRLKQLHIINYANSIKSYKQKQDFYLKEYKKIDDSKFNIEEIISRFEDCFCFDSVLIKKFVERVEVGNNYKVYVFLKV